MSLSCKELQRLPVGAVVHDGQNRAWFIASNETMKRAGTEALEWIEQVHRLCAPFTTYGVVVPPHRATFPASGQPCPTPRRTDGDQDE